MLILHSRYSKLTDTSSPIPESMALKFHHDLKIYINQTKFGCTRAIGIYVLNYQRKSGFIYPKILYFKQHLAIGMFYLH